jgi:hypothetical protein
MGEFSPAEADQKRGEIHEEVLGKKVSSKDLTNRQFDLILKAFSSYLVLMDGPSRPSAEPVQPCKRIIWRIEKLKLDEPYIATIARDHFRTSVPWRELPEEHLLRLIVTLTARAAARPKGQVVSCPPQKTRKGDA